MKESISIGGSPPIRLSLRPSWYLASFFFTAHGGAFVCLIAIEQAWPIKLLFGVAILSSLFLTLCEHAFRCSRTAVTTLAWTEEGVWKLWSRDGRIISLSEKQDSLLRASGVRIYVHPYLVVLHFGTEKGFGRSVVLHPGMVDDMAAFRRLRIRLRFL
ncbi:MAG: hypothetical protein KJO08_08345 [Gammaproteobacteria bacterium]|nr:hypothetical protein [Gammaproteobacteria bacterium]NNJ84621.1 hypothetical protein [Gammaproteobacteria bacterium]